MQDHDKAVQETVKEIRTSDDQEVTMQDHDKASSRHQHDPGDQRGPLIALLAGVTPDWWDENDIGIVADALLEADESERADRSYLAHTLWTYGMQADHEGCIYADGERDADYENACSPCIAYLAGVAAQVEEALR